MVEFWQSIDYKQFEEIAYLYASSVIPELKWIPTKMTRDGGKDGEALIFKKKLLKDSTIEKVAWYEAKYTSKPERALSKARIAATIISGLYQKDRIELILVITNSYFTDRTKQEILSVLGHKIQFIERNELEEWLSVNKKLLTSHEIKVRTSKNLESQNLKVSILPYVEDISIGYTASRVNRFETNTWYKFVFLLQNPLEFGKISLTIDSDYTKYVRFDVPLPLKFSFCGNHLLHLKVFFEKEGQFSQLFRVFDQNNVCYPSFKNDFKVIEIDDLELFYKSQHELFIQIVDDVSFSLLNKDTYSYCLEGDPGSGKTYLLNKVYNNIQHESKYYFRFCKSETHNAQQILYLLSYLIFGAIVLDQKMQLDDVEEIAKLKLHAPCQIQVLNYLVQIEKSIEGLSYVNDHLDVILGNSLFPERAFIVFDDLHYLSNPIIEIFKDILSRIINLRWNVTILSAFRSTLDDSLRDFLKYSESKPSYILKVKNSDIQNELRIRGYNELIPESIISQLKYSLFHFKSFILLLEKKAPTDILEFLQKKEVKSHFGKNPILDKINNLKLTKKERKLYKLIVFHQDGVKLDFIEHLNMIEYLDRLLNNKLIKFTVFNKKITVYHDLMLDLFPEDSAGELTLKYQEYLLSMDENRIDYLEIIASRATFLVSNLNKFLKSLIELHNEQNYHAIYYILRKCFKVDMELSYIDDFFSKSYLLYLYAYSSYNISNNDALDIFLRAFYLLKSTFNERQIILKINILSEIINCYYWRGDYEQIEALNLDVEKLSEHLEETNIKDVYGIFSSKKRLIESLLLRDHINQAQKALEFLKDRQFNSDFPDRIKIWILLCDFNLKFYDSPLEALNLLVKSNYQGLMLKPKDKLRCQSIEAMTRVLYCNASLLLMEEVVENYRSNKYRTNLQRALLRLGLCYVHRGCWGKLNNTIKEMIVERNYGKQTKAIYFQLLALKFINDGNHKKAVKYLEKQLSTCSKLGESFRSRIRSNIIYVKSGNQDLIVKLEPPDKKASYFSLETRY